MKTTCCWQSIYIFTHLTTKFLRLPFQSLIIMAKIPMHLNSVNKNTNYLCSAQWEICKCLGGSCSLIKMTFLMIWRPSKKLKKCIISAKVTLCAFYSALLVVNYWVEPLKFVVVLGPKGVRIAVTQTAFSQTGQQDSDYHITSPVSLSISGWNNQKNRWKTWKNDIP